MIASLGFADIDVAKTYPNRPKSVLIDRIEWARSYCKLGGALESPQRSLYLITSLGREITALSDKEASARLAEIDRQVRAARRQGKPRRPQLRRGHLLRMRRQRKASSTSRS